MKHSQNRKPRLGILLTALLLGIAVPAALPAEALTDAGIPNAVHKKYLNKIVWSNESISFTEPDESKFKANFTGTEFIWGRLFLDKSVQRYIQEKTGETVSSLSYYYDCYVDGVKTNWMVSREDWVTEAHLARTSQQVWFYMNESEDKQSDLGNWAKILNGLKPGTHEIRVDLKVKHPDEAIANKAFASGSFKLTKKAGDKVKFGFTFSQWKDQMKDPALTAQALESITNWGKSQGWPESFKKAKIGNTDWDIIRKANGTIIKRTVMAWCYSALPDGLYQVQGFVFRQDYDGSKYSKGLKYDGVVPESIRLVDGE